MSKLLNIILRILLLHHSTKPTVNQIQTNEGETTLQSDRCWQEALLAAMYDENARWYLDHYGSCQYESHRYG